MVDYSIEYNLVPELLEVLPRKGVSLQIFRCLRYAQIGIQDDQGFTGIIYDNTAEGVYEPFYFLHNRELNWLASNGALGKAMYADSYDTFEQLIEEKYPTLVAQIKTLHKRFAFWDDDDMIYRLSEHFEKTFRGWKSSYIISSNSSFKPLRTSTGRTMVE